MSDLDAINASMAEQTEFYRKQAERSRLQAEHNNLLIASLIERINKNNSKFYESIKSKVAVSLQVKETDIDINVQKSEPAKPIAN